MRHLPGEGRVACGDDLGVDRGGWVREARGEVQRLVRVLIGAMMLASWAWQATLTRSASRSSVMRKSPTTTASAAV